MTRRTRTAAAAAAALLWFCGGCGGESEAGSPEDEPTSTVTSAGAAPASPEDVCATIPVADLADTLGVEVKAPKVLAAGAGGCTVDVRGSSVSLVVTLTEAESTLEERAELVGSFGGAEPREVVVAGARGLMLDASADGQVALVVELGNQQLVVTLVAFMSDVPQDALVDAVELVAEAIAG